MELTTEQKWFIAALRDFLNPAAQKADTLPEAVGSLAAVWGLASIHSVLPMVYGAAAKLKPAASDNAELIEKWRQQTFHTVCLQAVKSQAFLQLCQAFDEAGIKAVVIKGILCRRLYPQPDYRTSSDEDIFAEEKDFDAVHEIMLKQGMKISGSQDEAARRTAHVITYINPQNGLLVELHRHLFDPDSEAFAWLDAAFEGVAARAVTLQINGVRVWSMNSTDHMLYLLLHAFKHFLHGGFGIRQTCDINLFARACAGEIDWAHINSALSEHHAACFAASVFKIGGKYLGFSDERYIPVNVPEVEELLADILAAGVYGSSSEDRKHSSLITLSAAASPDSAEKTHMARTLFPPAKQLSGKYRYLDKKPWLLPVAWVQRMAGYFGSGAGTSAAQSVRIGRARIELMRKYGIIDGGRK